MQPNKCYCALVRLAGYGKSCFVLTSRLKQLLVICKIVASSLYQLPTTVEWSYSYYETNSLRSQVETKKFVYTQKNSTHFVSVWCSL